MICTQSHTARKGRSWGVKAGLSDSSGSSPSWDRAPVQGDKLGGHGVAQGEVMVAWIEGAC